MTTSEPRRVLVLQAGARPGPWTCRSLALAGHDVIAAHDGRSGGLTGRSRWARHPVRSPSLEGDAAGYAGWMLDLIASEGVDVVVPATESATHLLATMPDLGGALRAGPDLARYRALCDKDGLAETAAAADVPTPRGTVVRADGPEGELPEAPCIVKPVSSATPIGGHVVYEAAVRAATDAERDEAVARIVASTGSAVVQQIETGARWRLHVARGERTLHAVAWRTERSAPRDTGMSSVSTLRPVPRDLAASVSRLLAAVDYRGIGSIQCFEGTRGFVVHDANLRPVFTTGASLRAGFDLPRMAVEIALGHEPTLGDRPVRPVRYVWGTGELRAAARAVRERDAAGAGQAVGDLVGAVLLPGRMLDPSDPRVVLDTLRGGVERTRRRGPAR